MFKLKLDQFKSVLPTALQLIPTIDYKNQDINILQIMVIENIKPYLTKKTYTDDRAGSILPPSTF